MGKIDDFVKQNSLKPKDCLYHTNRSVKGTKNGSMRVLVSKTDSLARCEYVCPECTHAAYVEQPWKRPFYVKCEKCGFKMSVPRIRDAAKRERKAESAK